MARPTTISREPMPVVDARLIQDNYEFLIDNIDAVHVIGYLFQDNIIDMSDKQTVGSEKVKLSRNRTLLDILLHRGKYALSSFIVALRNNGYEQTAIDINKTTNRIKHMEKRIEDMEMEIEDLKIKNSKHKDELTTRDIKINQLKTEINEITAEKDRLLQESSRNAKELADLKYRTVKLEEDVKKLKAKDCCIM